MDGLSFLRQQMAERPIPTVICSTLSTAGSEVALAALAAGAVAVVAKSTLGLKNFLESSRRELLQTLKAAATARPRVAGSSTGLPSTASASPAPPAGAAARSVVARAAPVAPSDRPVLIGGSTGGTQAIEAVLRALPPDAPGIAVVQHMPERFTELFARRLDGLCEIEVREARDGDRMQRGLALIAPGGRHLRLRRVGGTHAVSVVDGPPVNRHKPSVDVLFRSAAECAGPHALAILLTGMGDDGARGMQQLHAAGARCIAQDEASCVVFGMPRGAIRLGAVDAVVPLERVAAEILRFDARG